MSAGNYNLAVEAGTTFSRTFTWQSGSPPANVNLTGYDAHAQIRSLSGSLLLDLTVGSGLTLGGSAGTIVLSLTAAQTLALLTSATGASAEWDLKMTGSGTITRLLEGIVTVIPQVTQ